MYVVLLSGGSGKRLWPLSNSLRSKQYIKLMHDEKTGAPCSMIQRVWGQLMYAGLSDNTIICASQSQVEIIKSQLGEVPIAVEPSRRDTFPAVALSCAYIKDRLNATDDDIVCVIPVDPYTDALYFETIKRLPGILKASCSEITLMGAKPTEASSKYGYIIPELKHNDYYTVASFHEKPNTEQAQNLIAQGALWNCGVFCLKIGDIINRLLNYNAPISYNELFDQYEKLPKISFDYEVLEKATHISVVSFNGMWKDLGTWDAIADEENQQSRGHIITDPNATNTIIINELSIPIAAVGVNNLIVVASHDGILVMDKEHTDNIKGIIDVIDQPPMYEERRWGNIRTIDYCRLDDGQYYATRKLRIYKGQNLSYHYHEFRDEVWTILTGKVEIIVEDKHYNFSTGDSLRIQQGTEHAVKAVEDTDVLEVQVGETVSESDIYRFAYDWDEIVKIADNRIKLKPLIA
jgi:mannose-1-phosphate guanylyltransferase